MSPFHLIYLERKEIFDYIIANGNFILKPETISFENATNLQPERDIHFENDWKDALKEAVFQGKLEKCSTKF